MGGGGSLEAASAPAVVAGRGAARAVEHRQELVRAAGADADHRRRERHRRAGRRRTRCPFYNSIPASAEKAYLELNGASHFFPQTTNTPTARQMVAWLKRFVDDDTRYEQFLCPGPSGSQIEEYRNTCPSA